MNLNKIIQIIERKTFIYLNDINNRTLYIPRFIYDECIFHKIDMQSKPKIIQDKNYYSITRNQIKELEEKSNFKGIEKTIYLDREKSSPKLENVIFAFRDGNTNIIYIPVEYAKQTSGNIKTILNKKCIVTNERELEKILNKKIIIVTVYPKPEEIEEITICKAEDKIFIKEENTINFGLSLENRKKIKVNGTIYLEISREELNLMHIISTKEDHKITFIVREIVPKRGNV